MGAVGGGLGGQMMVASQATYGATFATMTRTLQPKSCKMTPNPHIAQGGPYLADGRVVDIGSARVTTWQDAQGTYSGDFFTSGEAMFLAAAMGSSATLVQYESTTAYSLTCDIGAPLANQNVFDMQLGVPDIGGTVHPENYHSTKVTKATWTIERGGLLQKEYDIDSQYVEFETELGDASELTAVGVFSYGNADSIFEVGTYGDEASIDGVRKAVITVEQKQDVARAYLGQPYKDEPITNALTTCSIALDVDYTSAAKTGLFDLFLAQTPISIIVGLVAGEIATSGKNNSVTWNLTNAFIQTGGEAPLDGPDLVKNTINFVGTIDAANNPALTAVLWTGDTTF